LTITPTQTVTPLPGSGYYDGGYGCQYYNYDPGFPTCDPNVTPTPTPDQGGGGRYNCTPSGCAQDVNGDYGSLAECQDSCVQGPQP
jgi:hypothetical protein